MSFFHSQRAGFKRVKKKCVPSPSFSGSQRSVQRARPRPSRSPRSPPAVVIPPRSTLGNPILCLGLHWLWGRPPPGAPPTTYPLGMTPAWQLASSGRPCPLPSAHCRDPAYSSQTSSQGWGALSPNPPWKKFVLGKTFRLTPQILSL